MQSIQVGEFDTMDDLGKSFFKKIAKTLRKIDPVHKLLSKSPLHKAITKLVKGSPKKSGPAPAGAPMVATPVPANVIQASYQTWSITGTDGNGAPVNYSFADQASAEAYGNAVLANGGNVTLNPPGGNQAYTPPPLMTTPGAPGYSAYPAAGGGAPSSNYYPAPDYGAPEGAPQDEPLPELAPEPSSSKDTPLPPEPQDGGDEEENPDQEEGAPSKNPKGVPTVPAPMIKAAEAPAEGLSPMVIVLALAAIGGVGYYFYNKNKGSGKGAVKSTTKSVTKVSRKVTD